MKNEAFSKESQAELLLKGEWHIAAQARYPEAWCAALTLQYLTITGAEIAEYAEKNPALAERYLERMETHDFSNLHDVSVIWRSDGVYKVAVIDHGTPRGVTMHSSIARAVAEHVSLLHGLPK